jgi:colicin import membrane protein
MADVQVSKEPDLLIPVPVIAPLIAFTDPRGLDPYLKRVRDAIDNWENPGVETRKGREEIAAFAYKISRSKTALEDAGKELAAIQKEIPRKIDASRKMMRDTLDKWRDEVRAPLTAWEQAEEARVKKHKDNIARLRFWHDQRNTIDLAAFELRGILTDVQETKTGPECEEYELDYIHAKEAAVAALEKAIEAREQYEAEQADLAKAREEKFAREAADRDARIAREATERAIRETEEHHQREVETARMAQRVAEELAKRAQKQAEEAQELAKRQADEDRRREAEEAARRAADARHKASVHQEAFVALRRELENRLELTWRDGTAARNISKFLLRLIADGKIPHVRLIY